MTFQAKSIRTFIGAKDFNISKTFYQELGFTESVISETMSLFHLEGNLGFYLQKYYVKDWINNSMVFLEVEDLDQYHSEIKQKGLVQKYKQVKLSEIKTLEWGREFFLHDPSGVLWHIGNFKS